MKCIKVATKSSLGTKEFTSLVNSWSVLSCTLTNYATFHFVLLANRTFPFIIFQHHETHFVYVSSNVDIEWRVSPYTACVAIDENNFLLTNGMFKACLVSMTDCWRYSSVHSVDGNLRNKLLGIPTTCVHKQSLWRIGDASEGDFTLVSGEGDALKVHSVVAMGCSPFFKAMMDTNMQEAVQKRLQVDISTAALQVAVGHFYGQTLNMTIIDAAELVGFAQMWCLPGLQKEAELAFKTEPPRDTIQAAFLWKKAFEAQNSELRQYAALQMRRLLQMESAVKPYEIPSDTLDTCL